MKTWKDNLSRYGKVSCYLLVLLQLTSCALIIDDDEDKKKHSDSNYPGYSYSNETQPSYSYNLDFYGNSTECTTVTGYDYYCFESGDTSWKTTCKQGDCLKVKVNVFYLLEEDLGRANTVVVEAFDNPHFAGSPYSSATMTSFDARAPGHSQTVDMYLDSKLYYFRAYIAQDSQTSVPYEYNGMQLVSERPIGIFGALSDLKSLDLRFHNANDQINSVDIYLDKLFKEPESETPSEAYLRLLLSLPDNYTPPYNRNIRIELHDKRDFAFAPSHVFTVTSESFLVAGRAGTAEFVSPQLSEGKYYLHIYVDENGNGFADFGEPSQTFKKSNEVSRVEIISKRTATLNLKLAIDEDYSNFAGN